MTTPLMSAQQLEELKRYNTPTISNAIEIFNIRERHLGFLPHRIRALFPDLGPMVGYAVTSQTRASLPTEKGQDLTADYLRYVASQPGPQVAIGAELERMERPRLDIGRSDDFSLEECLARRSAMRAKIRE